MTDGTQVTVAADDDFLEYRAFRQQIREKIVQTLTIWPRLSMSMLQVGIGTSISPKMWHPILDQLVKEGIVIRGEIRARSTVGRDQVYGVVYLRNPPEVAIQ